MYISVKLGDKTYGGYHWDEYAISVFDWGQEFEITFFNKEKERVYATARGYLREPTSNTGGHVRLSRKGAKVLYRLLGDVLLREEGDPTVFPVDVDETESGGARSDKENAGKTE